MVQVPGGSPLEGSMSVEIRARVQVAAPGAHAAFLTAFDDVSGFGAWHRRWCRLHAPTLAYWKYPDDVAKKVLISNYFSPKSAYSCCIYPCCTCPNYPNDRLNAQIILFLA
jgi:actin-binding protein anillin